MCRRIYVLSRYGARPPAAIVDALVASSSGNSSKGSVRGSALPSRAVPPARSLMVWSRASTVHSFIDHPIHSISQARCPTRELQLADPFFACVPFSLLALCNINTHRGFLPVEELSNFLCMRTAISLPFRVSKHSFSLHPSPFHRQSHTFVSICNLYTVVAFTYHPPSLVIIIPTLE